MNNYLFTFSAAILYFVCSALLFLNLRQSLNKSTEKEFFLSNKIILLIGSFALIFHCLALYVSLVNPLGINLGFYNALSLVSAFIVLFTLIATWRHPIEILAVAIMPLAVITMILDITNASNHLLAPDSSSALIFHILSSMVAYSLLALAALQAILLSIQNKFLHAHQPGGLIKLMPPLKSMERLLFEVIVIGFIALTVSLFSGLIFLENMFAQQLVHKTVLSIFAWLVFLILLIGHWKLGWRGRIATRWTLGGFISLMLAYFGSKFVLEVLLS